MFFLFIIIPGHENSLTKSLLLFIFLFLPGCLNTAISSSESSLIVTTVDKLNPLFFAGETSVSVKKKNIKYSQSEDVRYYNWMRCGINGGRGWREGKYHPMIANFSFVCKRIQAYPERILYAIYCLRPVGILLIAFSFPIYF